VVKLDTIQIEFDATPGMRFQQIAEIIGQLEFGQIINLIIEIRADASNGSGIGLDRLGLEAFEFKVFKMCLIILLEICIG
jgi:hypothetical protein